MKDFDISELNEKPTKVEYTPDPLRKLFLLCKGNVRAATDAATRYHGRDLKLTVAENVLKRKAKPAQQDDYWAYICPPTFEVHNAALKLYAICQGAEMPAEAITSATSVEEIVNLFKEPPRPSKSGTSDDIDGMIDGFYQSRGHGK